MVTEKEVLEAFEGAFDLLRKFQDQDRFAYSIQKKMKNDVSVVLNENRALLGPGTPCPKCGGTGSV